MPFTRRTLDSRKLPIGAEITPSGTRFRVWAPVHDAVCVVFEDASDTLPLESEGNGYFSGIGPGIGAGALYRYKVDGSGPFPDPASRFQPAGPHTASQIIDPLAFAWSDAAWPGIKLAGQVIYELHLGTFTREGTWNAASEKLTYLRELGITLIEVMPVSDFPGNFGWGYDGVQLYAPASLYGTPDSMRRFVDQAHVFGMGVVLDVVYNHIGPDGDYLPEFSPYYFTDKYKTDWGRAINFDGAESGPVREFFRENAAYWIREYHLDGLRLDATQDIHDECDPHILAEISQASRAAAGERSIVLIGENEPQDTDLIRPLEQGGLGLDALWNDDYHHTAMVAITGKADAYYSDYRGRPQEFLSVAKYGYLYQGQRYKWQGKRRGRSTLGLPRTAMVSFIQNHDQIANSARGLRAHELSSPGVLKALTALTLLGPGTPMLFQGQEFAASAPFLFFADQKPDLAELIRKGRIEFLEQWRALKMPEMQRCFTDPCASETFERCKLDFGEVETHASVYALHRDLLALRKTDPVFSRQGADGLDGAVLSDAAFVLRFFSPDFLDDRLLLVNLGTDLRFDPSPEPLLGPPRKSCWQELWSSDDARYGGCGTAPLDSDENWIIPGQAAVVLYPAPSNP